MLVFCLYYISDTQCDGVFVTSITTRLAVCFPGDVLVFREVRSSSYNSAGRINASTILPSVRPII
jgi:hypothetical protein